MFKKFTVTVSFGAHKKSAQEMGGSRGQAGRPTSSPRGQTWVKCWVMLSWGHIQGFLIFYEMYRPQ